MEKLRIIACGLLAALAFSAADARDDRLKMPIAAAMESEDAKEKLGTEVKFFFGSQTAPKAERTFGTFTSNKKTNFANKSDEEGCKIAFLSAIALRDRALREGGNAVVNIHSVYKNAPFHSETEYECGAGKIMGGVALRGTVVRL